MKTQIVLFRQSAGLINTVDAKRLPFDPKEGVAGLAAAVNIYFENGMPHRRKGFSKVRGEASHSMYANGPECLFVAGSSLYRLNHDGTRTGLRSGMTPGRKMYYTSLAERTFYSNGLENGFVVLGGGSYPWIRGDYVGPATDKHIEGPPLGTLMCAYNGRIFVAVGKNLFYSQPFAPNYFILSEGYIPCGADIRMLRAMDDGIWVGTSNGLIALSGPDATEFTFAFMLSEPLIPGTDCSLRAEDLKWLEGISGKIISFATDGGIYLAGRTAGPSYLRNISDAKVKFNLKGRTGASILNRKEKGLLVSISDREV